MTLVSCTLRTCEEGMDHYEEGVNHYEEPEGGDARELHVAHPHVRVRLVEPALVRDVGDGGARLREEEAGDAERAVAAARCDARRDVLERDQVGAGKEAEEAEELHGRQPAEHAA